MFELSESLCKRRRDLYIYKVHIYIADGKTAETTGRYSNSLSWPWGRVIRLISTILPYALDNNSPGL